MKPLLPSTTRALQTGSQLREPFKIYLVDISAKGVPPHLAENHFAKEPLAERGYPPPPLTENRRKLSQKMGQKGLKLAFFGENSCF